MKSKLLSVERDIEIHNLNDEKIGQIPLDIGLDKLLDIVTPNADDPELYDGYKLNAAQLEKLSHYTAEPLQVSEQRNYYLTAAGIYDW